MIEKAIAKEIVCSVTSETRRKNRLTYPTSASEAIVMPSCVAEIYAFKLLSSLSNLCALVFPDSANVSIRERRTPTNANSEATKNPLANTSRKTMRM
jgi:hypothetical protein